MGHRYTQARHGGFTLVEALAGLAIVSVVIVATTALIRNVSLYFDRGTRSVTETERVMLAVERLAEDFSSARFVMRTTGNGRAAAFSGEQADDNGQAKVMFVGNASVSSGPQGEEVVALTIERADGLTRLIRRRAPWSGPHTRFEQVSPQDAVVLIEAPVDIAFQFARLTPEGALIWSRSWIGESTLPRFVRLILRDRRSGADLLGEAAFVIRADAPAGCARGDAGLGCLAAALPRMSADPERTAR